MRRVKDALRDLNVTPRKSRGQNFLIDSSVINETLAFADLEVGENVVEIGPGLGALTEALHRRGSLTVIEIERRFCDDLKTRFPDIRIICRDVREVDFSREGSDLSILGNLPYAYSSDIVFHLISHASSIRRAVLLLQKEFVERMASGPGGRNYGALSIGCQLWADIRKGPVVRGESFHPPARVESQLVELRFLKEPRYPVGDLRWFRSVVRAAFSQRRKKLANSLQGLLRSDIDEVRRYLEQAGIDPSRRAETVSTAEFAGLSNVLADVIRGSGAGRNIA